MPQQWQKTHPTKNRLALEMSLTGVGGRGGPWYQLEYRVLRNGGVAVNLGRCDWADWDHREDLVFARNGSLFRQRVGRSVSATATQLANFNNLKFSNVAPPADARQW